MATDTNAYVPMRTGNLRSDVSVDGNKIRYNALNTSGKPYSKFVYYGKKYKHSSGGRKWGRSGQISAPASVGGLCAKKIRGGVEVILWPMRRAGPFRLRR